MSRALGSIPLNPDAFAKSVASHYGSGYTVTAKTIKATVANDLARHPITAGLSESTLKYENSKWKKTVQSDADKIDSAKAEKAKQQKIIDTCDDFLNKTNGYNAQRDAYSAANSKLKKAETALAKEKNSKKKKALQTEITSDRKTLKAISTTIKKISSKKDYQDELKKRDKANTANTAITNANKRITSWENTKDKHNDTYQTYHAAYQRSVAYYTKKKQAANKKKIDAAIADDAKNKYVGHTGVYRADYMEDKVFMLGEFSPSESNDQDVPLTTVDEGDPRSNYSVRTSKTMTGTYYLFGKSFSDEDKQFHELQMWARRGYLVGLSGFAKWKQAYMTNVSKSADTPYKNALACTITFSYVLKAPITYIKKQTKKKSKAKTTKTKGTSKSKTTTMRLPAGGTLYVSHKEIGAAVSYLKKLNPDVGKTQTDKWGRKIIKIGEN